MVGGAIFGIHADYWTDDELMMEHKRTTQCGRSRHMCYW